MILLTRYDNGHVVRWDLGSGKALNTIDKVHSSGVSVCHACHALSFPSLRCHVVTAVTFVSLTDDRRLAVSASAEVCLKTRVSGDSDRIAIVLPACLKAH
jgi:hypothetical protein